MNLSQNFQINDGNLVTNDGKFLGFCYSFLAAEGCSNLPVSGKIISAKDTADLKVIEALRLETGPNHPPPINSLRTEYEIGDKLGQGAFSVVKKIIRKSDGNQFALKISKGKSGWPTARGEAKLLDFLIHPNIIKFERFYHKNGIVSY